MGRMNFDEREDGEITEYEDISSDEDLLLVRQRIAEIEAKNQEVEKCLEQSEPEKMPALNHVTEPVTEKENSVVVAQPPKLGHRNHILSEALNNVPQKSTLLEKLQKGSLSIKKRKRTKKPRRDSLKCQLILSDDEFDTYDTLPVLATTEQLSPDPLPVNDEEEDRDSGDELVLKLRLEALQSKQEIKDDLNVILKQGSPGPGSRPIINEEQELRLIALKSAIVKKHEARKRRKENNRPYSPTDILDNLDVPSPPVSVQNMDISPLSSPAVENSDPVDMDIANDESNSPILFAAEAANEAALECPPADLRAVARRVAPKQSAPQNQKDEEDPERLRSLLLSKIIPSKKASATNGGHHEGTDYFASLRQRLVIADKPKTDHLPVAPSKTMNAQFKPIDAQPDAEDEDALRACLLSNIGATGNRKRARSEEGNKPLKPLSVILAELSKASRVKKEPLLSRTVFNDISPKVSPTPSMVTVSNERATNDSPTAFRTVINNSLAEITPATISVVVPNGVSPKVAPRSAPQSVRNSLVSEMPSSKVSPVIINIRPGMTSDSEMSDDEGMADERFETSNQSPLSIAIGSPVGVTVAQQFQQLVLCAEHAIVSPNFDVKLSEFLKKTREQVKINESVATVPKKMISTISNKTTTKKAMPSITTATKSVPNLGSIGSDAVKHLPASTQLEYRRLVTRMQHLTNQKMLRAKAKAATVQLKSVNGGDVTVDAVKPIAVEPARAPPTTSSAAQRTSNQQQQPLPQPRSVNVKPKALVVPVRVNPSPVIPAVRVTTKPRQQQQPQPAPPVFKVKRSPIKAPDWNVKRPQQVTLKERLREISDEQRQLLLAVQQKKVAEKRKCYTDSMGVFVNVIKETNAANRKQIALELELRRLRRLMKIRTGQLEAQKKLCNDTLHNRVQTHYQAMLVARQGQTTTCNQCLEMGRMMTDGDSFRLPTDGVDELRAMFVEYHKEVGTYKELRNKIKLGTYTAEDTAAALAKKALIAETTTTTTGTTTTEKPNENVQVEAPVDKDRTPTDVAKADDSAKKVERVTEAITEPTTGHMTLTAPAKGMLSYSSPLEAIGHLESTNPNGIICPFQLNGNCEDRECTYEHWT